MSLKLTISGNGIPLMTEAVAVLGSTRADRAYARALNDVGRPAAGKSIGATAKQMGMTRSVVTKRANIKRFPATTGRLSYRLAVDGGYLLMKDFRPTQSGKGTRAGPWATRRVFAGAFMGPRPGAVAMKLGGHVFHRVGAKRKMNSGAFKGQMRQPIQNMFGPAVPKEMVKGKAADEWTRYVNAGLEKRLVHHIKQATKGVLS